MEEIWKDITGYEGLYQVSNLGNVKSISRIEISGKIKRKRKETILTPRTRCGYYYVNLYRDGNSRSFNIHRLIAIEFIKNEENKTQVNHIDCNKKNNCVLNLEWVTPKENCKHARNNNLVSLTTKKIICTETNLEFDSLKLASKHFNINYKTLSGMLTGIRKNKTTLRYV